MNSEQRKQVALLRTYIGQGMTDYACAKKLGVQMSTLSKLKQFLFSDELESLQTETAAETWVRYHLKQNQNIKDLNEVIADASGQEQASALNARVGAIKAKADLIDRVFDKGQQLGVIPTVKAQEDSAYPQEIPALQEMVKEKTALLKGLTSKYGVGDFKDLPHTPLEHLYMDEP